MKNILIFAGGTGSIALQTGLHNIYGNSVNVDIVISAYDNGKSTGECRKVFNGNILGPSDLRKNQLTQFKLINNLDIETDDNKDKIILYNLFNERYSRVKWQDSYDYAVAQTKIAFAQIKTCGKGSELYDKKEKLLLKLIDHFFFDEYLSLTRRVRKSILTADLADFSISNIYYASAAALNGNSLSQAGTLMAEVLGIPDNVHLVSDINLYLHAETRSGCIISDEGVIVSYDNPNDPISNVLLLDEKGNSYLPLIDENILCEKTTSHLIEEADIIIFSSGTQWSSLIPTYMHKGFYDKVAKSKAAKYLVMNNKEDKDMTGLGAVNLLEIVNKYIPLDNVKIIMNSNADVNMSTLDEKWNSQALYSDLSIEGSKTHDPFKLVSFIMNDYYRPYTNKSFYFFDFDDTIWSSSKDPFMRKISKDNLKLLYQAFQEKSLIISGNSINHFLSLQEKFKEAFDRSGQNTDRGIMIYCNGGNCEYQMINGSLNYKSNILDDYNLNEDYFKLTKVLMAELKSNGWDLNMSNFENRGNCILSIKPLSNRIKAKAIIDQVIINNFPSQNGEAKYIGYINGNTTIDIMNSRYNKSIYTKYLSSKLNIPPKNIVYVGDKTESGNDVCVTSLGYTVLTVNDVVDFNVFARTILNYKK